MYLDSNKNDVVKWLHMHDTVCIPPSFVLMFPTMQTQYNNQKEQWVYYEIIKKESISVSYLDHMCAEEGITNVYIDIQEVWEYT